MSNIDTKQYIDYKVYNVTSIKKRYGYRVSLIYSDETTRTIQKSGFTTKKEANSNRNMTISELYNSTFIINDGVILKDFFINWLENEMKPRITSSSYDAYKNIIYKYIIPQLGKNKMKDMDRGKIQKFYNYVAQLSHSVAKLSKAVMNGAMKYALEIKIIHSNIAKDVNLPKCVKLSKYKTITIDTTKTLNEEQVRKLIEKSKTSPIHLQVMFAVLMGLRKGEINGLKYSDIDYIHRTLDIGRQLGVAPNTTKEDIKLGQYTKQEIKVKTFSSNRRLQIPDILFEEILEERQRYEQHRKRRINDQTTPFKDLDYICCSTYGNPRSKSFHFKYWKDLLKECELPDIRFHDLRATFCTLLAKNNFNMKAVSKMMGHASEIISIDVYTDNREIIRDCLAELEPFINDVIPKNESREQDFTNDKDLAKIEKYLMKLV